MFELNPRIRTADNLMLYHYLLDLIVDLRKLHKFDLLEFSSWLNLMQELWRQNKGIVKMKKFVFLIICVTSLLVDSAESQTSKTALDFSKAVPDPQTGQLCVMQQVCIADLVTISSSLTDIVSKSSGQFYQCSYVNWGQFHQLFTNNFCTRRSQKRPKAQKTNNLTVFLCFWDLCS